MNELEIAQRELDQIDLLVAGKRNFVDAEESLFEDVSDLPPMGRADRP